MVQRTMMAEPAEQRRDIAHIVILKRRSAVLTARIFSRLLLRCRDVD